MDALAHVLGVNVTVYQGAGADGPPVLFQAHSHVVNEDFPTVELMCQPVAASPISSETAKVQPYHYHVLQPIDPAEPQGKLKFTNRVIDPARSKVLANFGHIYYHLKSHEETWSNQDQSPQDIVLIKQEEATPVFSTPYLFT